MVDPTVKEEIVCYDDDGERVMIRCFKRFNVWHGEYKEYFPDKSVHANFFCLEGLKHGENICVFATASYRHFYIKGQKVDCPFLPPKPKSKPVKSDRTRFDTLEI